MINFTRYFPCLALVVSASVIHVSAVSANEEGQLAKELSNPLASLISIPVDMDFDSDIGPTDSGERLSLTAKPVIPFSLSDEWNLITRTIIPFVDQEDIFPGAGSQSGVGDILPSLWLSPAQPTSRGVTWGVGAAILMPTASDDLLGADTWALGPTVVGLRQVGPWTYGFLGNHIWDAESDSSTEINSTFLQPFLSYNTPAAITLTINSESTYDWEAEEWSVPINLSVSKVANIGGKPIQFKAGLRYWAESSPTSPEGWGAKLGVVFLLPK
jgi:hypothetical protein